MSTNLLHTSLLLLLNLVSVGKYIKFKNFNSIIFKQYNESDPLTQDVYWREYLPGDIPYDAVEAAPGRYIGQVFHEGFLVGTIYPHSDAAVIIFNNRQNINDNVKVRPHQISLYRSLLSLTTSLPSARYYAATNRIDCIGKR